MAKDGMVQKDIELGDKVVDTVTDFKGIVVCITYWLNGCRRIGIQSKDRKDGLPVDIFTADEHQVELIQASSHNPDRGTGGPRDDRAAQRR